MAGLMGIPVVWSVGKKGMPVRAAFLALLALFILAGTALAFATECPITVNTSLTDQWFPDISGNLVVWQDLGDYQIHLYDIATGIESTLVSSPFAQQNPVIDGTLVAWLEANSTSGFTDIVLYDLLRQTNKTLSVKGSSPAISGDRVVFIDNSSGSLNVTMYQNTTGTLSSPVFEPPNDRTKLDISGEWLVWVNRTLTRLYAKNLTDGNETLIFAATGVRTIPTIGISGDRIVWNYRPTGQWNVYIFNLSGLKVPEPVAIGSGQNTNPAIDGLRIVWSKSPDIYLLDLAGPGPAATISSSPQNNYPRISGDRVVWQKTEGSDINVYLYTNNSPVDCPAASFAVNPASGPAGMGIQFTDTSATNLTHMRWFWEFGDGTTSTERNPVHPYSSDGAFNVSLTVTNPVGRSYTSMTDAVRIGPVPIVSFTSNQTYGVAPLPVQFNDTSSGNPIKWAWDFGDGHSVQGSTLAEMNPLHSYAAPGAYIVSLSATNTNGTGTKSIQKYIRVLNGTSLHSVTDLDFLTVATRGAGQYITLDTTWGGGLPFDLSGDATLLGFTPPASTGWQRMTFSSLDGIGFENSGGTITGNLTSCILESGEIIPSNFGTGVGNHLPVSYLLSLSAYPVHPVHGEVNATVWEGVIDEDVTPIGDIVIRDANFSAILDSAYTLRLSTNIDHVTGAVLNLSVSDAWVMEHGNANNIGVVRLRDDGTGDVLPPVSTVNNTGTGIASFIVPSPRGLSRFTLVSATGSSNLLQMGVRLATQLIQSGTGSGSSYSGYTAPKDNTPWVQPTARGRPPERPAATFYGEAPLDITVAGITREAVIISSEDHGANILIPAGIEAFDATKAPLSRVSVRPAASGGIPMGIGAGSTGFTGIVYDVGPRGATFNPPAALTFLIPDAQWAEQTLYTIRTYDEGTGSWTDIPTTVDPVAHTLTGQVSHLCLFGVFAAPASAGTPVSPPGGVMVTTPQPPAAEPLPRTGTGIFTGELGWIYATATANLPVSILLFILLLSAIYLFTRRIRPFRRRRRR